MNSSTITYTTHGNMTLRHQNGVTTRVESLESLFSQVEAPAARKPEPGSVDYSVTLSMGTLFND